jgi:aromatic ring hydroxylase
MTLPTICCHIDPFGRFERAQQANIVIGGAMIDPKGDRSKPPD